MDLKKMDFKDAAKLGAYISKDYAKDIFRLLVNYKDISASETASRLGLHIRTAQEFLDAMAALNILAKKEVSEKKRPYFRYSLKNPRITMDIDLTSLYRNKQPKGNLAKKIRERKNARARFSTARNNKFISSVTIWIGGGREQKERKINLTTPQGKFLFHLPFPSAEHLSIDGIMQKAGVNESFSAEIHDIIELLEKYRVIEVLS